MSLLLVGLGGFFGSLARYQLGKAITERTNRTFPLGTAVVNLSGALLLGLLHGIGIEHELQLLLCDGFLGAYTTFSTFMYEGFHLFEESEKGNAAVYIAGTLLLGIIGCFLGFSIGQLL